MNDTEADGGTSRIGSPFGGPGDLPPFLQGCDTIPPITRQVMTRIQQESQGEFTSTVDVTKHIWNSVPMILFVIGMLGNILTVIIIARQKRFTSTTVYLLALAFSDMLLLCNAPLRQWIRYMYTEMDEKTGQEKEMNWRHWSESGCKVSLYLTYSSLHMSSWILVAVTMERVFSVMLPHWVKLVSTPKKSVIVILALAVFIFGLNTHFLYGMGVSELSIFNGVGYCEAKYEDYYKFSTKVWPWIDFAITFLVPFVFLVVGNTLIIWKLKRTRIQRRQMSVIQSKGSKSFEKDAKMLTVTLVLLAVVFFICLTPIQIYLILSPYRLDDIEELRCKDLIKWRDAIETNYLWYAITNNLGYLNASFNFVLYVVSGSKFRAEIKALFLCRKSGKEAVFGTSSNNSSLKMNRSSTTKTDVSSGQNTQL